MIIKASDIHKWLTEINVKHLFHANTVATSMSFVQHGALLSRGYCEENGITQTPQASDDKDKRYGVWHGIFLDRVDTHRKLQTPNLYGPVLFVFKTELLLDLDDQIQCRVTKSNPALGGHFKTGHRGSLQNRPTEPSSRTNLSTLSAARLASRI